MVLELTKAYAASHAAAVERQAGTAKGGDFEEEVLDAVALIATVYGDRAEHTGQQMGRLMGAKASSKGGDVTVYVDEEPAIFIEAMERKKSELTSKLVRQELQEAIQNRGARVALAVMSTTEGTLMCGQPLQLLGPDMWAVHLSKEAPSLIPLQVAYRLARHAAFAVGADQSAVDFDALKAGVEEVNRKLTMLGEVKRQVANIAISQEKATSGLVIFEREIREAVFKLLDSVTAQQNLQESSAARSHNRTVVSLLAEARGSSRLG